ncbi:hypothetical protein DH2020_016490 [Rehmannia glutinosa]|uniref:Uncharacterized protein n=1 Tax=Rehmannia glutinosa TaxID=99300 RepID=A0ABR0WSD7_REHGL
MLRSIAIPSTTPIQFNVKLLKPFLLNHPATTILKKPFTPSNLTLTKAHSSSQFAIHSEKPSDSDWDFGEEVIGEDDDQGCPWEGAIMYKRNASVSHLEYCTTLERLGLGKVSSEFSKTRASEMGLRVLKSVKDYPDGTPVLISLDVTRRKQKLRLDGIVRTVLALNCNSFVCYTRPLSYQNMVRRNDQNLTWPVVLFHCDIMERSIAWNSENSLEFGWQPEELSMMIVRLWKRNLEESDKPSSGLKSERCGEPAAQSVYSDFSLLLCEEPIREPETINMGVIFGEDKYKTLGMSDAEDDDDALIDLDDQLYFPLDEKVIDISKNIRDLIHVEITISAVCDPNCRGLCLQCGTNLNIGKCTCKNQKVQEKGYGPLGDLRKQMQQT